MDSCVGYKGDGWTCSLTDFDPDEILKVDYYNPRYNESNIGADYLAEDVIFDWGNATESPPTTISPSAKSAPIKDAGQCTVQCTHLAT